jgi:tRNA/rRNA methyltransferase
LIDFHCRPLYSIRALGFHSTLWPCAAHYNEFLLNEGQREGCEVVLVSPRNPLNIGAAARAMANFGFGRLSVVAPYELTWREARSAVGAPEVLENAKCTENLGEALSDCTLVVGTGTLTYRRPEQAVARLPELAPLVERELERGGRVAVVFGSEKHGLTREDLAWCHILVEIPTDARQPSMNLGQAVAVCLYELGARGGMEAGGRISASGQEAEAGSLPQENAPLTAERGGAAASERLELLAGVVEEAMRMSGYSPKNMQAANRHDLRLMLRRMRLSTADTRRILGFFRQIMWRLRRGMGGGAGQS